MNKGVLAAVVIILLLVLGGGAFVLSQRNNNPTPTPASNITTNTQTQAETGSQKSIKDLFTLGSAQQCSFNDQAGNSGTVFVANQKMRGDFITVAPQGSVNAHMIVDSSTSYLWVDGQNTGIKMSFDATAATENLGSQANTNVDWDKKFDYDCKAWNADSNMFTLPTGVKFTDLGALTIPSASGSPSSGSSAAQCAACDSVPESARAQCRAALKCN